jgi:uncharacterized protein (TIGR00251 family)
VDERPRRIRETASGLTVPLHVQPRAGRSALAGFHDGALKLKVAAPPVDDAANRAVIEFFATSLGIPRARLRIASGSRSREKTLQIAGMSINEFLRCFPGLSI